MAKRERIEDLGKAVVMFDNLFDHYDDIFIDMHSKHDYENFKKKWSGLDADGCENMENLHLKLRSLRQKLLDIYCICQGDDE